MKQYWKICSLTFQELLSYRSNFLLEVVANLTTTLMMIGVWSAIFRSVTDVNGYGREEMISYLVLAGAVNSFLVYRGRGDDVHNDIHQGNLSFFLVRPLNVPLYWFIRDASKSFLMIFFTLLGVILLRIVFHSSLVISLEPMNAVLFLASLLTAFCIQYLLFHAVSIMAFWMEQTWGPRFIFRVVADVAGGVFFPLSLLPDFWQTATSFLPFRFIVSLPVELLLGRLTSGWDIGIAFLESLAWIGVLLLAVTVEWRRGVRSYSAPGS